MAKITESGLTLRQLLGRYQRWRSRVPQIVGQEAVNFYQYSWRRQGWVGQRLEPWQKRKPPRVKARKSDNRATLVQTGTLRRSIRVITATPQQVVVGTEVPYAQAHNEGGTWRVTQQVRAHSRRAHKRRVPGQRKAQQVRGHPVRSHSRRMTIRLPKRQFMGDSPFLRRRLQAVLQRDMGKLFSGA